MLAVLLCMPALDLKSGLNLREVVGLGRKLLRGWFKGLLADGSNCEGLSRLGIGYLAN